MHWRGLDQIRNLGSKVVIDHDCKSNYGMKKRVGYESTQRGVARMDDMQEYSFYKKAIRIRSRTTVLTRLVSFAIDHVPVAVRVLCKSQTNQSSKM